jgi:hypothetical protein
MVHILKKNESHFAVPYATVYYHYFFFASNKWQRGKRHGVIDSVNLNSSVAMKLCHDEASVAIAECIVITILQNSFTGIFMPEVMPNYAKIITIRLSII